MRQKKICGEKPDTHPLESVKGQETKPTNSKPETRRLSFPPHTGGEPPADTRAAGYGFAERLLRFGKEQAQELGLKLAE